MREHPSAGGRPREGSYGERRADLLRRLRRIEGQVRGLQRMVEEQKYCVDVLIQIAAIKAALDKVGMALLEEHTRGCVRRALLDDESADAAIRELTDVILRYLR
ncbi:MAG TPA: metal-sensitive transcriptional regulator [Limnochordales bacterium]